MISIWKRMPWGKAEMHSFSYTNDQVLLYNQFSPYFLCRVSWLPIITNLGSVSKIRLNEYQLKSISFNYNICGIWKIFNNTRKRKYGLNTNVHCIYTHVYHRWFFFENGFLSTISLLWRRVRWDVHLEKYMQMIVCL